MDITTILFLSAGAGVLAILAALVYFFIIKSKPVGSEKIQELVSAISEGAMAFLWREYKTLSIFVVIVGLVLLFGRDLPETDINEGMYTAVAFLVGAFCSVLAGYIGMKIATKANGRAAHAAEKDLAGGFRIAFSSGAVMGLSVVGLGLLGLSVVYYAYLQSGLDDQVTLDVLTGFAFGASSIALFARVGGGIYTKAADVGADLVGKVEAGIPEDDPRNPATIADNVGDNVGDVAGMGADLFESYVGSIIAAMVLGYQTFGINGVALALSIAAVGIISSIIGSFFVRTSDEKKIHLALKMGLIVASLLVTIATYFITNYFLPEMTWQLFGVVVTGLAVGLIIGLITEYYTSADYNPVKKLAKSAETGSATVIINGLALGYSSTLLPIAFIIAAILIAFSLAGLYGIALAAVGMLSTLGVSLAVDAYGPVADNAGGIAEMAGLGEHVRERTDALDSAGNTTAAIGKGFAIGSAALTALALFAAYSQAADVSISLTEPKVIAGMLIGSVLAFLFCALTMSAVGRAAFSVISEVRRQFKEIKGLMEGEARAEYGKCVDIVTAGALKEMILPGVIAVAAPLAVGGFLGTRALGGMLAGALVTGIMLAISMANSGGAWDNAKKYIETGAHGGKGSEAHKAAVTGDTVGDPFKDTSGPALNILVKLMTIVSLIFATVFTAEGLF